MIIGRYKLDKTLVSTILYVLRVALKLIVLIGFVGYLGIDTSGIAALLTTLGVGVGLAVNGALSNLAGGALLIITRPFRIDDYIEAQGYSGTVEDIHITQTRVRTPDNKVIYIPNGVLSSGTIVNYSEKDTRRVDVAFFVDRSADLGLAKSVALGVIEEHASVLKYPEPFIRASAYEKGEIKLSVRVWVKSEDYWSVYFDVFERVREELEKNGIAIPCEHINVHIKND